MNQITGAANGEAAVDYSNFLDVPRHQVQVPNRSTFHHILR